MTYLTLIFLKIFGIALSSFSGVFALLKDYRDKSTGQITRSGKIGLGGIVLGGLISAAVLIVEQVQSEAASEVRNARMLELSEQNGLALLQLERVANRFNPVEVTVEVRFADTSPQLMELEEYLLDVAMGEVDAQEILELAACGIEFFWDEGPSNVIIELDNSFLHGRDISCRWQHIQDVSIVSLPRTRVSFIDPETSEIPAFFRIDTFSAYRHEPEADFSLTFNRDNRSWIWKIDDVPIRFRSSGPSALQDFLGFKIVVRDSLQSLVGFDVPAENIFLHSIDLDFQDGRGVVIPGSLGFHESRDGQTFFGLDLPTDIDELVELLQ